MRLILALALLPGPALADCVMQRACWDHACEPIDGGMEMTLMQSGDIWELAWQQGYMALTEMPTDDGTAAFVEPYQNGQTSILTLFPSGEAVLSTHRLIDGKAQVATFYGDCSGDGG
jgi:hypothetical protein